MSSFWFNWVSNPPRPVGYDKATKQSKASRRLLNLLIKASILCSCSGSTSSPVSWFVINFRSRLLKTSLLCTFNNSSWVKRLYCLLPFSILEKIFSNSSAWSISSDRDPPSVLIREDFCDYSQRATVSSSFARTSLKMSVEPPGSEGAAIFKVMNGFTPFSLRFLPFSSNKRPWDVIRRVWEYCFIPVVVTISLWSR